MKLFSFLFLGGPTSFLRVYLYVRNKPRTSERILIKFSISSCTLLIFVDTLQIKLKSDNNKGHLSCVCTHIWRAETLNTYRAKICFQQKIKRALYAQHSIFVNTTVSGMVTDKQDWPRQISYANFFSLLRILPASLTGPTPAGMQSLLVVSIATCCTSESWNAKLQNFLLKGICIPNTTCPIRRLHWCPFYELKYRPVALMLHWRQSASINKLYYRGKAKTEHEFL